MDNHQISDINRIIDDCVDIQSLLYHLQEDRMAAVKLLTLDSIDRRLIEYEEACNATMSRSSRLYRWNEMFKPVSSNRLFESRESFMDQLTENRQNISGLIGHVTQYSDEAFQFYNTVNADLIKTISIHVRQIDINSVWLLMVAWVFLVKSTENNGIATAIGSQYFETGKAH